MHTKKRIFLNIVIPVMVIGVIVGFAGNSILHSESDMILLQDIMKMRDPLDPYFTKRQFPKYKSDEIIIKFRNTLPSSKAYSIIGSAEKIEKIQALSIYKVTLRNKTVEQAIKEYKNNPDVEYVQPNYIYTIASIPNDPGFSSQWALRNTGQTVNGSYATHNPGCAGCDINITKIWDKYTDCSNIIVAVVDTGVNYLHEELKDNMWDGSSKGYPKHGYNFVENNNNTMDYHGHGTHVAGIIGAQANNGLGVSGICWKAKIMAVKVLSDEGIGYSDGIAKGIRFAVDNGAKIINMSLGGSSFDDMMFSAIQYARENGVLVVASAGNSGRSLDSYFEHYPCMYNVDNIICVGALDQNLSLASFSNYSYYNRVHIYAPGVNILSSVTQAAFHCLQNNVLAQQDWYNTDGNWAIHDRLGYLAATNPPNFDYTVSYKPNLSQSYLYKTFNVEDYGKIALMYDLYVDVEPRYDYFKIWYANGSKNPLIDRFTLLKSLSVSNFKQYDNFDIINDCSPLCTVAFSLDSDYGIQYKGVIINNMSLYALVVSTDIYKISHGTSMATPIVTGTAALLWSANPDNTYYNIRKKIIGGADIKPFANGLYTYRVLNVKCAFQYISKPQNVRVQPL